MGTPDEEKNRRKTQKKLKKDSAAYLRQREKANARKRKFLDKMTEEQKEIKRAKDREYYKNKKAENKMKRITDMTESEKRNQRKNWKKASVRNNITKFKQQPKDVSYINFEQIIKIIPTPLIKKEKNGEYYYFDNDIGVFEKYKFYVAF